MDKFLEIVPALSGIVISVVVIIMFWEFLRWRYKSHQKQVDRIKLENQGLKQQLRQTKKNASQELKAVREQVRQAQKEKRRLQKELANVRKNSDRQ